MNKVQKWVIPLVILVIIIGVVFYHKHSSPKQQGPAPIRIGVLTFPTGPLAAFGEIMQNSLNLAVDQTNKTGGVSGRQIELVYQDYAYDAKRAVSAYQTLNEQGLKLFIMEGSPVLGSVGPLIRQNHQISIVPSAVLPSYADSNPLTCRIAAPAGTYGPVMGDFISKKFSHPRVAFLVSNNDFGRSIEDKLTQSVMQNQGQIVMTEHFEQADADFRTSISKLKARQSDIDVLIIVNGANTIETMLRQIKELGFNKPLMADTFTANNSALKTKSLEDGMFYADYAYSAEIQPDDSPTVMEFKKEYYDRYNAYPPAIAVNNYDAFKVLIQAVSKVGDSSPEAVSNYLIHDLGTYQGLGGQFSFNDDCEVQRGLVIKQFQGDKSVVIQ